LNHAVTTILEDATRVAAIAGSGVAVVALLRAVEGAVATGNPALTQIRAGIRVDRIAIVALLASSAVDDSVPAALDRARGTAAIAVNGVAVVTLLAACGLGYAVATPLDAAVATAAVTAERSAVIALFGRAASAIATSRDESTLVTAVRRNRVAVVALLDSVENAIAATDVP
jgi:hypothetical protein